MTAFMLKARAQQSPVGHGPMIALPSWMFMKSFGACDLDLRDQPGSRRWFTSVRIFRIGLRDVAFWIDEVNPGTSRAVYRRLFDQHVDVRFSRHRGALPPTTYYLRGLADGLRGDPRIAPIVL